jgi:cob(I)alamin adenosyltransferase
MKIYTRTGDSGDTGLFGGGRVPKDHPRVSAYGAVDELNAVIGVSLATDPSDFERPLLLSLQRDLFAIGGRLAAPNPAKVEKALAKAVLPPGRVGQLEAAIDRADKELEPLSAFVLPGGSPKAAALHHARTVCRRAEREVVRLARDEAVPTDILVYLNRLSDLLFTVARLASRRAGAPEETW